MWMFTGGGRERSPGERHMSCQPCPLNKIQTICVRVTLTWFRWCRWQKMKSVWVSVMWNKPWISSMFSSVYCCQQDVDPTFRFKNFIEPGWLTVQYSKCCLHQNMWLSILLYYYFLKASEYTVSLCVTLFILICTQDLHQSVVLRLHKASIPIILADIVISMWIMILVESWLLFFIFNNYADVILAESSTNRRVSSRFLIYMQRLKAPSPN